MKIEQEELNQWAETAFRVNGLLLHVADYLRRSDASQDVQAVLEQARSLNFRSMNAQVRAGADDPLEQAKEETRQEMRQAGYDEKEPEPLSLHLLNSSAARKYTEDIRAAAVSCRAMETERGIDDGLAESLEDLAESAEYEFYGPKGLRE